MRAARAKVLLFAGLLLAGLGLLLLPNRVTTLSQHVSNVMETLHLKFLTRI